MSHPLVVHCKRSKFDTFVGRPSPYGNPFKLGIHGDRDTVVRKYRDWLLQQPELLAMVKRELRGKVLGCFCSPDLCHGEILAEIANAGSIST